MKKVFSIDFSVRHALLCFLIAFSFFLNSQTVSIGGVINTYVPVADFDTTGCRTRVVVTSTVGFSVGDSVLMIQMKGADFDSTNTAGFGAINSLNGAGNYEIAGIASITSNSIMLNGKLLKAYDLKGRIQLIRFPSYLNANVTSSLTCQPWNGQTGGVLIFNVQNNLQLNANIDVKGQGFRGGTISNNPDGSCGLSADYFFDVNLVSSTTGAEKGEGIGSLSSLKLGGRGPQVNGGGGGNKHNAGGGGGSNFTGGGRGGFQYHQCALGNVGGVGGLDLSASYTNNVLFAGGGGGCGDQNNALGVSGEKGGGIIIITASVVSGNNFKISADGNGVIPISAALGDGAGGGGGGGSVFLNVNSVTNLSVTANGGSGGSQNSSECLGPGGGGGTGAILTNLLSFASAATSLLPGAPGIFVNSVCSGGSWFAAAGVTNTVGVLINRALARVSDFSPALSVTPSLTVCSTQSLSFLTTLIVDKYIWTGPSSFVLNSQTLTLVNASIANAGNYTLTADKENGCRIISTTSLIVNLSPTITVSSASVCDGQPININPVVLGAVSYSWIGPAAFSSSLQNVSISVSSAALSGIYSLTATSAQNCTTAATPTIDVAVVNSIIVSANNPVCLGGNLFLLAGTGSGNLSYAWTGPGSFTSALQNPTITAVAPANAGSYTVIASVNTCTASKVTSSVTVEFPPVISLNNASVCITKTIVLVATSPTGVNYSWMGPNSFSSNSQSISLAVNDASLAGAYNVTVTSAVGCSNTAVSNLTVVNLPPTVLSSNQPVCSGSLLSFTTSGAGTYTLFGPNNYVSATINPSITNVSIAASGMYTLVGSAVTCTAISTSSVFIKPQPSLTLTTQNTVCVPRGFQLLVAGGATYTWTGPSGFSSNLANPSFSTSSLINAGIYSVVSAGPNGCLSNASTSVAIVITPNISATGALSCFGDPAMLQSSGASSYTWTGPNSFTSNNPNPFIPVANNNSVGAYTLIVTTFNTCTVSATVNLSLLSLPVPTLTAPPRACFNTTVQLFTSGGVSYTLRGPSGLFLSGANPSFVPANSTFNGTYTLQVRGANGCTANATSYIFVDPVPIVKLSGQIEGCLPFCSNFELKRTGTALTSPLTFIWTTATKYATTPIFNNCFTVAGNFVVTGRVTDTIGCTSTNTFAVNVRPKPTADFDYSPVKPVENIDNVFFTSTSTGDKLDIWSWFIENKNGAISFAKSTNYFFENVGTFPVALAVRNEWGCWDTIIKPVIIGGDFNMFVPQVFTPNGDGLNEYFQPKGSGFTTYELTIFDRWGQKLFRTNSFETGWDGNFRGSLCTDDVYAWQINAEKTNGKQVVLNGYVALTR